MATTAQANIGLNNFPANQMGISYSYPMGIAQIPFASFIRINKYSYEEGMDKVGKQQNDVLGSLQNSGLLKNITGGLADTAQWAYGDKTGGNEYLAMTENDAIAKIRENTQDRYKPNNSTARNWEDSRSNEDIRNEKFEVSDGWGTGKREVTLNELLDQKDQAKKFHDQGYAKNYCNLAMPNEFQYDYGANWNNTFKLGTMALAADDPARATAVLATGGLLGGIRAGAAERLSGNDSMAAIITDGVKEGTAKAGNLFGVNSDILDPTNIVGMAGLAPNENAIQFFKKMEFRKFELNFEFASRSAEESTQIQEIITWFKHGMHPVSKNVDSGGSGVLLGFPDVWTLEPRFTPGNAVGEKFEPGTDRPHPMMPATKLCALTGMRINSSPMGSFTTVFDGTIPLVTITLTFNELTALTRSDFMTNKYL